LIRIAQLGEFLNNSLNLAKNHTVMLESADQESLLIKLLAKFLFAQAVKLLFATLLFNAFLELTKNQFVPISQRIVMTKINALTISVTTKPETVFIFSMKLANVINVK